MSELVKVVDSLENKISKLLHKMELLQQTNTRLEDELNTLKNEREKVLESVSHWENKYNSLKLADTMFGREAGTRDLGSS